MKSALLFFTLMGLLHPVCAQEKQAADLQQLLDIALKTNPEIQAAEQRMQAARAATRYASALPDPMFSYTRWLSGVETRVGPQENVFSLSQRIPFPGKLGLQGQIAGQDLEAARHALAATQLDVVLKVKSTYAELFRIDQSLTTLNEYENLLRDFSEVAATKYAVGQGMQAQILKAGVEISSIAVQRLNFEKMRTSAVARMNALLDQSPDTEVGPVTALDTSSVAAGYDTLVQQALEQKPELQANEAMITKAELAHKLAGKDSYPDLNVQATYVTIPKLAAVPSDAGKDPFALMVGVNLPIWFGKNRARVEQAQAARVAQELRQKSLQNAMEAEVADVLFQMRATRQTLQLYEQGLLVQAESSLESALSAYKTGNLDFLNLLDAERMLLQFRLAYFNEIASYFKQVAALERATGGTN